MVVVEVVEVVEVVDGVVEKDHGSMNHSKKNLAVSIAEMTMLVSSLVEVLAVDSMIAASLYQNLT